MEAEMKVGDRMVISRICTPSTGYQWYLAELSGGLLFLESGFEEGGTAMGRQETKDFVFLAVKAGPATIQFAKCRPFAPADIIYGEILPVVIEPAEDGNSGKDEILSTIKVGGWSEFRTCTKEDADFFKQAVKLIGVGYTPVCVTTQASARRYIFAVNGKPVTENSHEFAAFIEIGFSGTTPVIERIIKVGNPGAPYGGYGPFMKIAGDEQTAFEKAIGDRLGASFTLLYYAVRIIAGSEYTVLANEKISDKDGTVYPVVMKFTWPAGGTLELTDIQKVYTL
jgi:hypothetical protein